MITTVLPKHNIMDVENTMEIKMKDEIYTLIRRNSALRVKIAEFLGVIESTVYDCAKKKRSKLTQYWVVEIIKNHTGFSEKEILKEERRKIIK